jgi:hypothetical protein
MKLNLMKKNTRTIATLAAVIPLCALSVQSMDAAQCSTRRSGEWNDDLWTSKYGAPIEPGLRPGKSDQAYIYNTATEISLSDNVHVSGFKLLGDKTRLTIKEGAGLRVSNFQGKGIKGTGVVEMLGGVLRADGAKGAYFILAGHMPGRDDGTGIFIQRSGVVTIESPDGLQLTRSGGTGIDQLHGGGLNITAGGDGRGISAGEGTGKFEWRGGTLNTKYAGVSLDNEGGVLSPGGDDAVGSVALRSKRPETYHQSGKAKMVVNVENAKKYDELIWKDESGGSTVHFGDGSEIEIRLSQGYKPSKGDKFDVVFSNKIVLDGTLRLEGPHGDQFRYEIVRGSQEKLRLIYERK